MNLPNIKMSHKCEHPPNLPLSTALYHRFARFSPPILILNNKFYIQKQHTIWISVFLCNMSIKSIWEWLRVKIDSIDMATYECVDCQLTSLVANENRYPNVVLLLNIKAAIQNKDWRRKSRKPMIQSIWKRQIRRVCDTFKNINSWLQCANTYVLFVGG